MPVRNFVSDSGNLNSYFGVPDGPSFGVYLRDIGFHKTSPCHNFGPAVRDYWLIHVIKSGKGWFHVMNLCHSGQKSQALMPILLSTVRSIFLA